MNMQDKFGINNFKYTPNILSIALFFVLYIIVFALFLGRTKNFLRIDLILDRFPSFYQHISNFSISYLLYAGVGFVWLFLGLKLRHIALFGFILIAINLIYELWIPILNTPDLIDAYFGVAGTSLAFLFLLIVKIFGLIEVKVV